MPDFYLTGDESIVMTNQSTVLDGLKYEAILTNRRLILIRIDDPKAPSREIALREIGSVIGGETSSGEPTITLTSTSAEGVLQAQELIFPRNGSEQGTLHYMEWVDRFKERVKNAANEPVPVGNAHREEENVISKETFPHEVPQELPPVAEPGPPVQTKPPVSDNNEPQNVTRSLKIVIIVTLIIAAGILGALGFSVLHKGVPAQVEEIVTTETTGMPPATTVVAISIPATTVTTNPVTTIPIPGDTGVIIPPSGIWVRVQYKGNFTGSVGIQGSLRDVEGKGDRFFQIPATGGIIDANIQKQDYSGDELGVVIYKNGTAVKKGNTTAPGGTLFLSAWI